MVSVNGFIVEAQEQREMSAQVRRGENPSKIYAENVHFAETTPLLVTNLLDRGIVFDD